LYGEAFLPAAGVLSIHIWAGVFVGLGVACGRWFLCENYIKKNFYRTLFGMVINVVLNLILIPLYGIYGAAVATLLGQMAANLIYDIFDKQIYPSLKLKINALNPVYFLKRLVK
jgi:O-antigen/teichoic acid export membrane protein